LPVRASSHASSWQRPAQGRRARPVLIGLVIVALYLLTLLPRTRPDLHWASLADSPAASPTSPSCCLATSSAWH
jgi:hypothetical protein